MYYPDRFQKPNPFKPDVVVATDSVIEKRLDALDAMPSQFYEGGANGSIALVPMDPEKQKERKRQVRDGFARRFSGQAQRFKKEMADWYGADRAANFKYAEAFEICEYGKQPNKEELARLFPFHAK
jgi:N-acetylglucosamine malate deacetylase 1